MGRAIGQRRGNIAAFAFVARLATLASCIAALARESAQSAHGLSRSEPFNQCRSIRAKCGADSDKGADDYRHLLGGCLGTSCRDDYPFALPDESLEAGLRAVGGTDRVQHLLRKLRDGQPITVVAFGGSVTHGFGGCWNHDGCEAVKAGGSWTPRLLEETMCLGPFWCKKIEHIRLTRANHSWTKHHSRIGGMVEEPGRPMYQQFLARFMQHVETQFPQKGHRLFNMGYPQMTSKFPLSCPADYIRSDADLVVMEHALNSWNKHDVKELLANVLRLPNNPAVLLLNLYMWNVPSNGCARKLCAVPEWPRTADEMHDRWDTHRGASRRPDVQAEELAQEYGLGMVSMNRALMSVLTATSFPPPPPIWPMSELLDIRGIHPEMVGSLMPISIYAADLMVHWLQTAVSGRVSLPDVRFSTVPDRHKNSSSLKCLGWITMTTPPEVLANYNIYGDAVGVPEQYRDAVSSTGWFYAPSPLDGPPAVRARSRPGFASVVPGATVDLKVAVDNSLYRVKGVTVYYMASYTNTGMAAVSCVAGCTCTEGLMDARHSEQTTGYVSFKLRVSDFEGYCVLRLVNVARPEAWQGTGNAAGESKFKINKIQIWGDLE